MDYSLLLVIEKRTNAIYIESCDNSISYKDPTKGRNCLQSKD